MPAYYQGGVYVDLGVLNAELYEDLRSCNSDKERSLNILKHGAEP